MNALSRFAPAGFALAAVTAVGMGTAASHAEQGTTSADRSRARDVPVEQQAQRTLTEGRRVDDLKLYLPCIF